MPQAKRSTCSRHWWRCPKRHTCPSRSVSLHRPSALRHRSISVCNLFQTGTSIRFVQIVCKVLDHFSLFFDVSCLFLETVPQIWTEQKQQKDGIPAFWARRRLPEDLKSRDQDLVDAKLERRRKGVYGPPMGWDPNASWRHHHHHHHPRLDRTWCLWRSISTSQILTVFYDILCICLCYLRIFKVISIYFIMLFHVLSDLCLRYLLTIRYIHMVRHPPK